MPLIVIDPGHQWGSVDTGAIGNGLYEQDLTLEIALEVKKLLLNNNFKVLLTREGRIFGTFTKTSESLSKRAQIANNAKADMFISIHINALGTGKASGSEVFVCDMSKKNSIKLAQLLASKIASAGKWPNRGVKYSRLQVLREIQDKIKGQDVPAVLSENGFIDNAGDANKLKNKQYIKELAKAHAIAVCEYFGVNFKEEEDIEMENLVIFSDGDIGAAIILHNKLRCPMVMKNYATEELLSKAKNKHWIGVQGKNSNGNFYYAGANRVETAREALK